MRPSVVALPPVVASSGVPRDACVDARHLRKPLGIGLFDVASSDVNFGGVVDDALDGVVLVASVALGELGGSSALCGTTFTT